MPRGGKQPGSGRKEGGKNLGKKLRDYITNNEIEELVALAKEQAKTQPIILKFVLEQIFGKAVQPLANDTDDTGKPRPLLVKFLSEKDDEAKNNDSGDTGRV